jgi:hypothetical protein
MGAAGIGDAAEGMSLAIGGTGGIAEGMSFPMAINGPAPGGAGTFFLMFGLAMGTSPISVTYCRISLFKSVDI